MELNVLETFIRSLGKPDCTAQNPPVVFRHYQVPGKTDGDIVVLYITGQPMRVFVRTLAAITLDAPPNYKAPDWLAGNKQPSPFFQHFELQREDTLKAIIALKVEGQDERYFERMTYLKAIEHLAEDKGVTTSTKPGRGSFSSSK